MDRKKRISNASQAIVCILFALALCAGCGSSRLLQTNTVMCEDTCHHVHGIDVSHHQNKIDWKTVSRRAHVQYVYIKATEGATYVDKQYKSNLKKARKRNLAVGSYHFFRPGTPLLTQMDNLYHTVHPRKQDLVPMIDVETAGKLSRDDFRDSLRVFLAVVEAAYGCKPIIYTGQNFYNKYMADSLINGYPLMVANYSRQPELDDGHAIWAWQYTGSGSVRGVNGQCDKSRLMEGFSLFWLRFPH